jgi:D-alanyl-D-alanine dipeptidase
MGGIIMQKIFVFMMFLISAFAQTAEDELVNPKDFIPDIVIDMRYSTPDHWFRSLPNGDVPLPKFYTANECLAVKKAVDMLAVAQDSLRNIRNHNGNSYPNGIGIKIWDAYRPRAVQYLLFEIYPNPAYVADPSTGSKHNRGGAIDLTLIDLATGEELNMPTEFDDFSISASHDYMNLSQEKIANRELLKSVMTNVAGFQLYSAEWWHYEVPGAGSYPLLDFQMK